MSTPIERLRESHAMRADGDGDPFCGDCGEPWPCDVIAALDALEVERVTVTDAVVVVDQREMQARIDAATELMLRGDWSLEDMMRVKAWLAGDKEATDA